MITDIKDLAYGGKYHKYFWDVSVNPKATITSGLADCDCFVLGDIASEGLPQPVSSPKNADTWHLKVTNGWTVKPYNTKDVEVGDVIQWIKGCHVARVCKIENGTIYISGSFYTGIHGRAYYNGKFDVRTGINSLKELWDFMYSKYPSRVLHVWSVATESKYVGYQPDNIIKKPTVLTVAKNENVNQINVLTNVQNIRNSKDQIIGTARKGYYNVISTKRDSQYTWYEVEKGKWIAGVSGRVVYYPAKNANQEEIEKIEKEIKSLEARIAALKKKLKDLQ